MINDDKESSNYAVNWGQEAAEKGLDLGPDTNVLPFQKTLRTEQQAYSQITELCKGLKDKFGIPLKLIEKEVRERLKEGTEQRVSLKVECPGDWNDDEILNDDPAQTIIKSTEGVILERGDLSAIIGKSKSHKSFLALQVALSVCAGRKLFETFDCPNAGKVLILQTELKDTKFKRRILRMADTLDIPRQNLNDNLRVINARGVICKPEAIANDLIAQAKGFNLIVIDPIYLLLDGDENKTETVQRFANWLRDLAEQTSAAVMVVHHDAKGQAGDRDIVDRGSGSGVLTRFMDTFIAVTKHVEWKKDDKLLVIETMCRNTQEPGDFTIRFTQGVLDSVDKPAIKQTSHTRKKNQGDLLPDTKLIDMVANIINAKKGENPFSAYPKPKDVIETLKAEAGISKDRAMGILEQAKADTKRFIYYGGKGNPKTYITTVDTPPESTPATPEGNPDGIQPESTPATPEGLEDDTEMEYSNLDPHDL